MIATTTINSINEKPPCPWVFVAACRACLCNVVMKQSSRNQDAREKEGLRRQEAVGSAARTAWLPAANSATTGRRKKLGIADRALAGPVALIIPIKGQLTAAVACICSEMTGQRAGAVRLVDGDIK